MKSTVGGFVGKSDKEKIDNALTEYDKCYVAFYPHPSRPDIPIDIKANAKREAKEQFVEVLKRDIYPLLSNEEDHKIFENFEKNSIYDLVQLEKIGAILRKLQKNKA